MASLKIQRYQELWAHLVELFPWLEDDVDKTITFELYRYNTVERGSGYMSWCLSNVKREFWDKVVVAILDELQDLRVRWRRNKYNPEAFFVLLPSNRDEVAAFRTWTQTGQTVGEDLWDRFGGDWDDVNDWWDRFGGDWDDVNDWWDFEDPPSEYDENEFYKARGW